MLQLLCRRSTIKIIVLVLFLFYSIYIISNIIPKTKKKACADFNLGLSVAAEAGLSDPYVCPRDGVAKLICSEAYPVKPVSSIVKSSLSYDDILVYVLVGGTSSNVDPFLWWLPIVDSPMDVILISDACADLSNHCDDAASKLLETVQNSNKIIRFKLFRVNPSDSGYMYLSCKLRMGARLIYENFPSKKYYFKVDSDTVLFPKRLMHFLRTLDSITASEKQPLYFGTAMANDQTGIGLLLCGRHWRKEGKIEKGGLCYAQGGAGYGLNSVAMHVIASSPICDPNAPDISPEDTFVGLTTYDYFKSTVIHCGGFGASGRMDEVRLRRSITFHHIDSPWLEKYSSALLKYN